MFVGRDRRLLALARASDFWAPLCVHVSARPSVIPTLPGSSSDWERSGRRPRHAAERTLNTRGRRKSTLRTHTTRKEYSFTELT